MISVRIPKEIKEFKEKIAFGLTIRQLISSVIAIGVCVPLYIYGRKFLSDDVISWIVIAVALPCAGIGFIKKNGMPFEKYLIVLLRKSFYPQKVVFKSKNFFRALEVKEKNEELQKYNEKKMKKYRDEATLERALMMERAEQQGLPIPDIKDEDLVAAKKPSPKKNPNNKKDDTNMKKANQKSKAQIIAEEVEEKKRVNPQYIPTKQEGKMLLTYAKELEKKKIDELKDGMKTVAKTNNNMKKRRNAKTNIPKSTQDDLPYIADYEEGLFEVDANKYSKCYEIGDINYLTAKEDEAVSIFCKWGEFLNYFSEEMTIEVTLDKRIISLHEREKMLFFQMKHDDFDEHRKEFNKFLRKQMINGTNDIQKNIYICVTIDCDSPYEALLRFHKIDEEVIGNLRKIGSNGRVLSTDERLSYIHDKMRKGREGELVIDYNFLKEQGISSKDYVAPSYFFFKPKDYFMIEDTYHRCMYLNNLPASLSDDLIMELTDVEFPVIFTMNIQPVAQEKAIKLIKRQITGMEANKIEAQKKAIRAGYDPGTINHDLAHSLEQGEELLDDMLNKNQKMFFVSIMMMVSGNTLDELNDNTSVVMGKARAFTCQLQTFDDQQREAYKSILPMGVPTNQKLYIERTLTTESTSIFIPFSSQELFQKGGLYYGLNQVSKNLVICNRLKMKTPSGFILGSSGSGKSFKCKEEMLQVLLSDDKTGLLIVDPENEYTDFGRAFNATIVNLSASADCYINPMDMDEDYGLDESDNYISLERKKEKALQKKSEYLMSIIQYMIVDENSNTGGIKPRQKSLIDRVIKRTYQEYLDHDFDKEYIPTLVDFQNELDRERDTEEGREIAEVVEYYTRGSMNLFSHKSNIDMDNRFVIFSIRDLGRELKQIALMITMDFIWNRMVSNKQNKTRTYCYVDEIHVLFQQRFSERYLQQLYKRGRKYGLVISGITQDVEDLLRSEIARGMLSNSDYILMLNQSAENLKLLQGILNISQAQAQYISMSDVGSGLLFAENTIVPFFDQFPETSYLYTLMSTRFGDDSKSDMSTYISKLIEEQALRESEEENNLYKGSM